MLESRSWWAKLGLPNERDDVDAVVQDLALASRLVDTLLEFAAMALSFEMDLVVEPCGSGKKSRSAEGW